MSELQKVAKGWLNDNMHDGCDRSSAHSDWHKMSAPELYEMVNDLVEHLEGKFDLRPSTDITYWYWY